MIWMSLDKKAKALEHNEETDRMPTEAVKPVVAPIDAPMLSAPMVLDITADSNV